MHYKVNFADCQQDFVIFFDFVSLHKNKVLTMTTFYKNYVQQCANKNVSLSAAAEAVGLSRTSPNGWKKGKQPSDVTLQKLSDYFGCSISDLTGEVEQKEKPAQESGLSVDEIKEAFRGKSFEELTEILAALTDELKNTK